jgi:hypothetical protein
MQQRWIIDELINIWTLLSPNPHQFARTRGRQVQAVQGDAQIAVSDAHPEVVIGGRSLVRMTLSASLTLRPPVRTQHAGTLGRCGGGYAGHHSEQTHHALVLRLTVVTDHFLRFNRE